MLYILELFKELKNHKEYGIIINKHNKVTPIKKLLIKSLLLLYILSSYLNAIHIHDSHTDKADKCQVCIVVKNFQSADVPSLAIEIASLDCYFTALTPNAYEVVLYLDKGFYSTAPPSYSFI